MAKVKDQFEKFREATLGGSSLSAAISTPIEEKNEAPAPAPVKVGDSPAPVPAAAVQATDVKEGKNVNKDQVAFHLNKEYKKKLGLLKYETERSFNDLYEEAIADLLKKYGRL